MNTQKIANRLVELCRKGEFEACYQELYNPAIKSIENDGTVVSGFDGIAKKGKDWIDSIEEFLGSTVGEPIIAGNYFSLPMSMDVKFKGTPAAIKFEEICVYEVKEGKIVKEQFFYDEPG